MTIYKCCWNCGNGFDAVGEDERDTEEFAASKRFCCASHPVSSHSENPFKRRRCKQFVEPFYGKARRGHIITQEEAARLETMSIAELVSYWRS